MRPSALPLVAGVLFAVGCQKTETTRTVAAPAPAVLAAAPPAPAAPRAAPQPAAPAAPAADTYAARTKQLLEAAEKGRISQILELLQKGANVNDKDDDGQTALHKAAARGHKSALVALLAMGADMGERDAKGRTPLMSAAEAGNAEVVTLLVTPGTVASLAGDVLKAGSGKLPAGLDKLGGALQNRVGAALDQTDPAGQTALMLAAAGGHTDCVKALLAADSEGRGRVLRADRKGRNALLLAAAGGHADALEALLRRPWVAASLTLDDLRRTDRDGKTALDLAEASGHKSMARLLWVELADKAAFAGDLATVKAALAKCPDVPASQVMGRAAAGGSLAVVKHLMGEYKDKSAEEKLRLMGAKPPSTATATALQAAMNGKQKDVVTVLIDADWWQDKAALAAFCRCNYTLSDYYRAQVPDLVQLVEARLKQVETAK
jgi:ankyrin repeat protein